MQLYNQNLHLVDNLLRAKGSQGLVRDHPDLPGDESMRLYYVTLLGFIMVMPMLPIVPRHPSSLLFDVRFSWICPTATRLKSQILCSIALPWKLILRLRPGFCHYYHYIPRTCQISVQGSYITFKKNILLQLFF
jgi:hypothetical protein